MKRLSLALTFALACATPPAFAQGEATPLFASNEILELTLDGPIREIVARGEKSTDPHPATLSAAGESHAIQLSARGNSRRLKELCRFPPLRVRFEAKPDEASLFHRQGSIKLVTHCRDSDSAEQTMLREYAAYRLYNVLTPESFRVRLARVSYRDGESEYVRRLAFFIEDGDDTARRLGLKELDVGDTPLAQVDREDAARYALFQYMIGNTDWAMVLGPTKTDCCHNSRLFGASQEARSALVPVPYDFDNSGLVDAGYAVPNPELGTYSVRTRVYRGFCSFNDLVPAAAARMRALRGQFEASLAATPEADARTVAAMTKYLATFYEDIEDEETIGKKLLKKCR